MGIGFSNLSLSVYLVDGEVTRSVEVEIGIERLGIEVIDGSGVFLRDMSVAHELADDSAVFAFGERVIVGVARAGSGEFDAQLVQKSGDVVIHVLGSSI